MEQMKAALVGIDAVIDETYGWGDSYALDTFMTGFNFTAADVASGDYPFLSSMTLRHDALKVPIVPVGAGRPAIPGHPRSLPARGQVRKVPPFGTHS